MRIQIDTHYLIKILLGLIIIFGFNTQIFASGILKPNHSFGKRADEINIDLQTVPEPTLSKTKKAYVTANRFGFDVLKSETNWVVESFINNIQPGMIVLDVGSGYGALTRMALNKGAIVISNDICCSQLLYNLKLINPEQKSKLYLNNKDIRRVSLHKHQLDAIMFHRILPLFKGKDIESILKNAHRWLKVGGRIYIVTMSKDHVAFRDKVKYKSSKKWPGEDLVVVKKHLPDQAYALPKRLHVMSIETLVRELEKLGFQVEKVGEVSLKNVGTETNRDGKEAIGLIAIKN